MKEGASERERDGARVSAARRIGGCLPKQASVVELNKRRSYQFIMGRHVAHARAYGGPPSFLPRYITACTRVALENWCTLTVPGRSFPPPALRPSAPPSISSPPLSRCGCLSRSLCHGVSPSSPFLSLSRLPLCASATAVSLLLSLRLSGTKGQIEF